MAAQFDELVLSSYARLCQFAYRIVGSRAVAEDIVQDVFASLWRRQGEFDFNDPLPYLYRAVRNRAISLRRQEHRRAGWLAQLARERQESESSQSEPESADLASAIEKAVASLPERRRLIFAMSREQHLSYGQIAQALDISIKTVETQMGRALRSLRDRLAPYLE
jgi:RNA polymerase sigma-70 factor (ECF subfamily)